MQFKIAATLLPKDAEPLLCRGKALQKLARPRAAVEAFSDALRLEPDDPAAWYGLALAYEALGDGLGVQRAQARLEDLDEWLSEALSMELARSRGIR